MPICQTCGQNFEVDASKVLSNVMSEYVDPRTGKVDCVLNTAEPKVEVREKILIRADLYQAIEAKVPTKPVDSAKTIEVVKPSQGPSTGEGEAKQTAIQPK